MKKKSTIEMFTCSISIKNQIPSNCWEVDSWTIVDIESKDSVSTGEKLEKGIIEKGAKSLIETVVALSQSATTSMLWLNDYDLCIGYIEKELKALDFLEMSKDNFLKNKRLKMAYCHYEGFSLKIKTEFHEGESHYIIIAPLVNLTRHKLSDAAEAFLRGDEAAKFKDSILLLDNVKSETLQYDDEAETAKQAFVMAFIADSLRKSKNFNLNTKNLTIAKMALEKWQKLDTTGISEDLKKIEITKEIQDELRKAYKGGLLWLNPVYQGKDLGEGMVLDINSFYSFVMRYCQLPVSKPRLDMFPQETWQMTGITYIGHFSFSGIHLKKDGIPCMFDAADELIDQDELIVDSWLTNYDIVNILSNYKIDSEVKCLKLYTFETASGMFDNYIDYFYKLKRELKGTEREIVKLFLESLYGRFGVLKASSYQYLPMSVFITSIARYLIVQQAKLLKKDRIIQLDTDGLHFLGLDIPEDFDIGPELGQFKIEDVFSEARYIAKRAYCHKSVTISDRYSRDFTITGKGQLTFKMCRLQDEVKSELTWENFRPGFESNHFVIVKKDANGNKYRCYTKFRIKI